METTYTFDEQIVSDLHKDAYGFRPSAAFYSEWSNSTDDGKQAIWDNLLAALSREIERQEKAEALAVEELQDQLLLIMTTCNCDRPDALRHLHEAHNTNGDWGYLEYCLGVPYGYFREDAAKVPVEVLFNAKDAE